MSNCAIVARDEMVPGSLYMFVCVTEILKKKSTPPKHLLIPCVVNSPNSHFLLQNLFLVYLFHLKARLSHNVCPSVIIDFRRVNKIKQTMVLQAIYRKKIGLSLN